MKAPLAELGLEPYTSTPDDFVALVHRDRVKWSKLIADAGVKPER